MQKRLLSKTKTVALSLAVSVSLGLSAPAYAGIPVTDGGNIAQSSVSAIQNVAQTLKQIEEYRIQLKQYETQLRNSLAPAAYVWDQANKTMANMKAAVARLRAYKQQLGNMEEYLSKFQAVDFCKSSPCFTAKGCSAADRAKLEQNYAQLSRMQKLSNDGLLRSINNEIDSISRDANTLTQLQRNAQSATGQLEALQYANQFHSAQAHQLLQLRNMINTEMQANAAYRQSQLDREARYEAARKQVRTSDILKHPYRRGQ